MIKNENEPIIGAQYEWLGEPCTIINVESEYQWLNFYEHMVTVEYFNKDAGKWSRLKTPWLAGAFKLTFAPAVCK